MSTQIKNTLFKFVNMRAPELSSEDNQDEKFIFRNKELKGLYDEVVAGKPEGFTKWEAMKEASSTFSYLTLENIKSINPKLYQLSTWIAKNRTSFKIEELNTKIDGVVAINDSTTLMLLWNNLFYQTITQKDFYAKEIIIQLLLANHFITKYDVNTPKVEHAKMLLNAKVVLPKSLFVEDKTTTSTNQNARLATTESTTKATVASDDMVKQQIIAQTSFQNEQLEQLVKELKIIEKNHQKEYNASFTLAEKAHQVKIKPILDEYNTHVEETRKEWCSVRDPQVVYDPKDPCNQQPSIPKPELPEFNFTFRDELDIKHLESKLSKTSYDTLLEITNNSNNSTSTVERGISVSMLSLSEEFETIGGLNGHITNLISNNNEIINNNISINENSLVSIGGVLVPITVPVVNPFSFQICSKPTTINALASKKYNSDLSFVVPDNTWNVSSFNYTLEKTTGNYTNGGQPLYTVTKVGNKIFLNNIFIGFPTLLEESDITSFKGEITFTNGTKMSFIVEGFNLHQCFTGKLKKEIIDLGGNEDPNDSITIPPKEQEVFIPSGFGIKQLGIADYQKVEQTTQNYIEGEVAHIENIMAREFKERTTRKLRRSDITNTSSSEREKEQLTDTSSTSRFEMQNEVAQVLQENKDFYANANVSYEPKGIQLKLGASTGFATNSSKENSTHQAITEAKEITEKALDRLVTKVKQERIEKIVEEFEESNTHGFDNRKGDKHVVGVYRWVDKIYKNQILNYGKRLMFEFMIPQPAKLHILGMTGNDSSTKLIEPTDPRVYNIEDKSFNSLNLSDYSKINDNTIKYWGSKYNVELEIAPAQTIYIGKSFSNNTVSSGGFQNGHETFDTKENLKIPEGYYTKNAEVTWASMEDGDYRQGHGMHVGIGNLRFLDKTTGFPQPNGQGINKQLKKFEGEIPLSAYYLNSFVFNATATIECERTPEYYKKWQQETFKSIIDAYENALKDYNQKIAEQKEIGVQIKGTNPGFYREFENKILRKNCISYLISQNPEAKKTYGKDNMFKRIGSDIIETFGNTEVNINQELDDYVAFVKFIEQAFEWDIISYHLYPYYWGNRTDWNSLYQYDDTNDPLFRNFMQAGMAKVVVTVRPGFEDAVRYYMQTGQIWNGGEIPVIEDELYLSIIDELRAPEGEKTGKAWWTRVPTAMTILQAQSIGLKVDKALPENGNLSDFEDPDTVPQSNALEFTDAELGGSQTPTKTARLIGIIEGSEGINAKIILKRIDGSIQDLTYCDENGKWELNHLPAGRYELLLDAENDFPNDAYIVTEGSKEQVVELVNDQTVEAKLVVKKV
ncbi:hypothetical protein LXD69_05010 [Flavobacterium sediminilitoris]|uniref:Carboxypeptidase family protein n=1 Tax=Flavobacterium sediminilitoris TaxID=2024526 RepID=A0ABY4HPQ5_9FLAO|nr:MULTISPECIES: hypothetical protein [Flavobacterium]UOX34871.1 hypothetical protein LXD69_05010 [Flavobacterium sediminilitoris]